MCVSTTTVKSFQNWKFRSLALEHCTCILITFCIYKHSGLSSCSSYPPCSHPPAPAQLPPVGMHMLNYISMPLDYILHIQVFGLQDYPPSWPAAPSSPLHPHLHHTGRKEEEGWKGDKRTRWKRRKTRCSWVWHKCKFHHWNIYKTLQQLSHHKIYFMQITHGKVSINFNYYWRTQGQGS